MSEDLEPSSAAASERRRSRSAPRRADRAPERAVPVEEVAPETSSTPESPPSTANEPVPMPPETTSQPRPASTTASSPESTTKPAAGQKPGAEGENPEGQQQPKQLTPMQEAAQKLEIIKENKDAFEWVLKQHSELRVEFISFLRKDMKEIQQVLADVKNLGVGDEMAMETMEMIKNTYIEHWRKSFDLITPDNVLKPAKALGAPEDVAKGWFKNNG